LLKEKVDLLIRRLFGAKSEKLDVAPLELLLKEAHLGKADASFRVLAGERPPVLSPPDPTTNPLLINWRALKKWHVSESRIPSEATVRYRDPSLWEEHPV
jgi:Transposase C of IS166 homeodomain